MKIAILTSGILPVPAVLGGAVENLIDFYLEYNEKYHLHDITVFSVFHPSIKGHPAFKSKVNKYYYIRTNTIWGKIQKRIYKFTHGANGYYHYSIEFYLSRVINCIQHQQFDIILIENRPGFVLKLKDMISAKLVIHQENDYLNNQTKRGGEIYNNTTLIINTSNYITQQVKTINKGGNKCVTVLNGINTTHFYNATAYSREKLGFNNKDFIIIYSGRLTQEKGILPLIQAIKQLNVIPHLKLLIIGASSYGIDKCPTPFVEHLQQESESIRDQVIYTGFVDYQLVPSFLKMGEIAVVPSMWEEPFGLTVVEAIAAGLPLITTRSGGIPEICEGVATIVDRQNIVENLAAAILDLYQHPKKRQQMAKASLERSKLFDKETFAKNFFAALEDNL